MNKNIDEINIVRYHNSNYDKVLKIYFQLIDTKINSLVGHNCKTPLTDQERLNLFVDLNFFPGKSTKGIFIAKKNNEVVGLVVMKWKNQKKQKDNTNKRTSLYAMIKKYKFYNVVKIIHFFFTCSYYPKKTECYIEDLVIDKNHRGNKIGSALLTFCREFAVANHFNTLSLHVKNTNHAHKFYLKHGFKDIKLEKMKNYQQKAFHCKGFILMEQKLGTLEQISF